jgi:hypothetical protein
MEASAQQVSFIMQRTPGQPTEKSMTRPVFKGLFSKAKESRNLGKILNF